WAATSAETSHNRAKVTGGVPQSSIVSSATGVVVVVGGWVVATAVGVVGAGSVAGDDDGGDAHATATRATKRARRRTVTAYGSVTVAPDAGGPTPSRRGRSPGAVRGRRWTMAGARRRRHRARLGVVGPARARRLPLPSRCRRAGAEARRAGTDP